ncbi:winged helix-turn-helix transcriptional regulator [Plantactinospora sp. DSM 117369]
MLAPARIIGVYGAITASAKFGERRRLARSRHAGYQNLRHGDNATDGPQRHSELTRRIAGVSQQMLTQILRKLERVGCSPAR